MADPWRWRHMMAEVWYGIPKDTNRRMSGDSSENVVGSGGCVVVADDAVA